MKRVLKKYFIPHDGNDHKPHLLRKSRIIVALLGVLFIELLFLIQVFIIFPSSGFFAAVLPSVLVDGTNTVRANTELSQLRVNSLLTEAAKLKAEDMAENGYFAHTSPNGVTPWFWLNQVGYKFNYAGENLAVNFVDSDDVIKAWMNSDGHKANILQKNFTEIGIATAKGNYKGRETIFVVQFFGRPQVKAVAVNNNLKKETTRSVPIKTESKSQDMFIELEVAGEEIDLENKIIGGSTELQGGESTFFGRVASKPRTTASYIFMILAAVIGLALILKIFVKVKIQHPKLIINGLALMIVLVSALFLNEYLSLSQAQIF